MSDKGTDSAAGASGQRKRQGEPLEGGRQEGQEGVGGKRSQKKVGSKGKDWEELPGALLPVTFERGKGWECCVACDMYGDAGMC
jgi:hypothetical protein